jgi:hypothetical protein
MDESKDQIIDEERDNEKDVEHNISNLKFKYANGRTMGSTTTFVSFLSIRWIIGRHIEFCHGCLVGERESPRLKFRRQFPTRHFGPNLDTFWLEMA